MKRARKTFQVTLCLASLLFWDSNLRAEEATTSAISANLVQKNDVVKKDRRLEGDLDFTMMGRRFEDPIINSRFARLIVELNLAAFYQDWLSAHLSAAQLLTSGQASNLYAVTEGGTGSGTFINEASLGLNWGKAAKVMAGIVQNTINPVYSQMYPQSNAGGYAEVKLNQPESALTFSAHQSIPTSKTTSNRVVDEDTLPLLTVGALAAEIKSARWGTRLRLAGAHFIFTDLSSQSAADSQQTGSDTVGNGKGGFLFAYEYRGNEYAAALEQELFTADKVEAKVSAIQNEMAPAASNRGWQGKLEYTRAFNNWSLLPSFARFHMEANSLPSVYSLPSSGFTNRDGYSFGLKADFPVQKFNLFAGYTRANLIDLNTTASAFQADREIYTLGAEAKYDLF